MPHFEVFVGGPGSVELFILPVATTHLIRGSHTWPVVNIVNDPSLLRRPFRGYWHSPQYGVRDRADCSIALYVVQHPSVTAPDAHMVFASLDVLDRATVMETSLSFAANAFGSWSLPPFILDSGLLRLTRSMM